MRSGRWLPAAAALLLAPTRAATAQAAFFRSDSVIAFTLRTDFRRLLRDRDPDTSIWHGATLSWESPDGPRSVPLRVRTRGLFRLRHCDFPLIRLRFDQDSVRGTPWDGLRRPKLATHCRERSEYEQYLLQEYAINRAWRLLTPLAFPVRLARVTYEDSAGERRPVTHWAFLSEDPERFAERLGGTLVEREGIRFGDLQPGNAALVGAFEYFIGNTDWSVPGRHNVEFLQVGDTVFAVPYDFDWSGVVDAQYARPSPILPIRSVTERLWRGHCPGLDLLEPVLARFEALRDSITALVRGVPGLEPRLAERTVRYYDDFYRLIANRERFARDVVRRECRN